MFENLLITAQKFLPIVHTKTAISETSAATKREHIADCWILDGWTQPKYVVFKFGLTVLEPIIKTHTMNRLSLL